MIVFHSLDIYTIVKNLKRHNSDMDENVKKHKKMFRDHHIETFQFKFELVSTNVVVAVLFCSVITAYLFTVPNRTYDKSK